MDVKNVGHMREVIIWMVLRSSLESGRHRRMNLWHDFDRTIRLTSRTNKEHMRRAIAAMNAASANRFRDTEIPDYNGDHSVVADNISKDRRTRLRRLRRYPELRKFVIEQLEAHWSPEQICGRLISHGLSAIRLCAETIYRFIYSKEEYALKLYEHLAEMRTKRCPRGTRRSRSSRIPEAFCIHQRPDFIGNRLQFGNWEGGLIIFDRDFGEANVMTLVERKSRNYVIIKNSSRHSKPIMNKITQAFAALPYHARRSFIFDRGS